MNKIFDNNENVDPEFEIMFKKFKNKIKKEGILEEVKARRYYSKPSEKRRLEQKRRERYAR